MIKGLIFKITELKKNVVTLGPLDILFRIH